IRYGHVTGVQTCALPIYPCRWVDPIDRRDDLVGSGWEGEARHRRHPDILGHDGGVVGDPRDAARRRYDAVPYPLFEGQEERPQRSEERRVGKECRAMWEG